MRTYYTEQEHRLFGNLAGQAPVLKDVANTAFTDYVTNNILKLQAYARRMDGVDANLADDLVNDLWMSYTINESDGTCYSCDGGNTEFTTVEAAVKQRMKLMALKKDRDGNYIYQKCHKGSKTVTSHFSSDNDDEDDLQRVLTTKASEINDSLINVDRVVDSFNDEIREQMVYFIACTTECNIKGETILENIGAIVNSVKSKEYGFRAAQALSDIFNIAELREAFSEILHTYTSSEETYFKVLKSAKEEYEACRALLMGARA